MRERARRTEPPASPRRTDVNAIVASALRDLAGAQADRAKKYAYDRAASVVFWLDRPIDELRQPDGSWPKLPGLGPSSMRVVAEVLDTGDSPTADAAVRLSGKAPDFEARRASRTALLSAAGTRRILSEDLPGTVARGDHRADFQMHSTWSDGGMSLEDLVAACRSRGYSHCAVTDHAKGLRIARGMTMETARAQHVAIDRLNAGLDGFRLLKGIEANLAADGSLDVGDEDRLSFDIVLAAPHAEVRTDADQTGRLLRAVTTPGVHILAHPRGRKVGARAGIVADWDAVFRTAAVTRVAIEIDGDPSRQDLDHVIARRALGAGCLFALDSDAHRPEELVYADISLAHARLAGIPAERIVNCWPLDQLLQWSSLRKTT